MRITFFNQAPYDKLSDGYGDSTLIELDNGKNVLLDISGKKAGKAIIAQMKQMGINSIDTFVASHLHMDHVAGFDELADTFEIGNVITSGYAYKSIETDTSFLEALKKHNIKEQTVRMGDSFSIGETKFEILFPPAGIPEVSSELPYVEQEMNSNFYSMVIKMTYLGFTALFAGDLYAQTEKEIVERYKGQLKSTLLKIPHHGSVTSTCDEFLEQIEPAVAVILGRTCDFEVQKKFSNRGVNVYGPFFDGGIVMETDGVTLSVECNKGKRTWNL